MLANARVDGCGVEVDVLAADAARRRGHRLLPLGHPPDPVAAPDDSGDPAARANPAARGYPVTAGPPASPRPWRPWPTCRSTSASVVTCCTTWPSPRRWSPPSGGPRAAVWCSPSPGSTFRFPASAWRSRSISGAKRGIPRPGGCTGPITTRRRSADGCGRPGSGGPSRCGGCCRARPVRCARWRTTWSVRCGARRTRRGTPSAAGCSRRRSATGCRATGTLVVTASRGARTGPPCVKR